MENTNAATVMIDTADTGPAVIDGASRPLLMLIPPLGHHSSFYAPMARYLEESFELLLPDYPYDSSCTFEWESENLLADLAEYFIDCLRTAALDDLPARTVLIGGVSLGATLSIYINHELKGRIDQVILMATGGLKVATARKNLIRSATEGTTAGEFIRQSLALDSKDYETSSFARQFNYESEDIVTYWNHLAQQVWHFGENSEKAGKYIKTVRAALEVDYEDLLHSDGAHFNVIWGRKDKVFSMRAYRKLRVAMPDANFHLIDDLGHYAPLEAPQRIAELITGMR